MLQHGGDAARATCTKHDNSIARPTHTGFHCPLLLGSGGHFPEIAWGLGLGMDGHGHATGPHGKGRLLLGYLRAVIASAAGPPGHRLL